MSMVDVVNVWAAPAGADAYAGYGDGIYLSYSGLVSRFPNAKHLDITVLGSPSLLAFDCESGNAGPVPTAAAARARFNRGLPSVIYTNGSWHPSVTAALVAEGLHWNDPAQWPAAGVYWWAANPTGYEHLVPGSIATQWLWMGGYDLSLCYGDFPAMTGSSGVPAPSPVPAPAPARVAAVAGFARPQGDGYWIAYADGHVTAHGGAKVTAPVQKLNQPVMGGFPTPSGNGFWLVAADGGVFSFGDAVFHGSMGGQHLNARMVGGAASANGGYWLFAQDGGVFTFGGAPFEGSEGSAHLNAPVVGGAALPDGKGYWLVAHDGGIFSFGGAPFEGSLGSINLNAPIMGMCPTPGGKGYWMVASDGGVFSEGTAPFHGAEAGHPINAPMVDMARTKTGNGYWLFGADGGVFSFGDAKFYGSDVPA